MLKSTKRKFDFVNIAGNVFNTITDNLINREYEINVSAVSAALDTPPYVIGYRWVEVRGLNDAAPRSAE